MRPLRERAVGGRHHCREVGHGRAGGDEGPLGGALDLVGVGLGEVLPLVDDHDDGEDRSGDRGPRHTLAASRGAPGRPLEDEADARGRRERDEDREAVPAAELGRDLGHQRPQAGAHVGQGQQCRHAGEPRQGGPVGVPLRHGAPAQR